jgi:glycerophosphoryl diester phosphodiesterase
MTRQIEIVGHRGARGLFPENTREGFRSALALGVRAFELDVGLTADGVAVVTHDLSLNRAIVRDEHGRWLRKPGPPIHRLTFDALQEYDVGRIRPRSPYRLLHRRQIPCDGARIPRLEDVLRLAPEASFLIELKTDPRFPDHTASPERMAEAVLDVVDRTAMARQVAIESFDWRGPRHVRRLRPDIALAWLTRPATVRAAVLWWDRTPPRRGVPAAVAAEGGKTWAPAWESLSRANIQAAHALGLRVLPWTVNRRAAMRRLADWGADGLITDRPDLAMRTVQSAML